MAVKYNYARVETIEPTGECGFFKAEIEVRETLNDTFHGMAITVLASDLTTLIDRVYKVLQAFNVRSEK